MKRNLILIAAVLALAACTEKPQTAGSNAKVDTAAYQGAAPVFSAAGWKPGDKDSWEQHLKTRLQNGQNDYAKIN